MSEERPSKTAAADETTGFDTSRAMAGWIQEIVPFGIFTTDREFRLTSWNDWLAAHSGLQATAVLGRRLAEIYPKIATPRLDEQYARALLGEISFLSVALHRYLLPFPSTVLESGLPHMLQTARIAPVSGPDGVTGTITIIEDVTQREFQAVALNRQHGLDRLLSEALATLLQSGDPAGEMAAIFSTVRIALNLDLFVSYLMDQSDACLRLNAAVGVSPKQREVIASLSLTPLDFVHLRSAAFPVGTSIAGHAQSLRHMDVTTLATFPLSVGGRIIGMVVFGSYERTVIPLGDLNVLSRIARYVAIALDRARREQDTVIASRAKDDFLAALSHELRTPLNPVLLVASDAKTNPNYPEEAREAFSVIEKNALLEARLIDDLLDLTRIEHGKLGLEVQKLEVHSVLRDAVRTVQAEVKETGLSVELHLGTDLQFVIGDSGRLQQVFWNVLKNAVKFSPGGGTIHVTSFVDFVANTVAIQISDPGIGMDASELARVFDAFAQGDHAERGRSHRFGGLGLGLAISRKLIEMHAGRIEATSKGKGHGSTFTIFLPLLSPADKGADLRVAQGKSVSDGVSESHAPFAVVRRILLVEDHAQTRATLQSLLVRRGYDVVAAGSAQEARDAAENTEFALVLSDIGLPDSDGFVLMRDLRDRHGLQGIALTGYGMEEDLARSSSAGFIAHLTKPISVAVLDRALDQIFQKRNT